MSLLQARGQAPGAGSGKLQRSTPEIVRRHIHIYIQTQLNSIRFSIHANFFFFFEINTRVNVAEEMSSC